MIASLPSTPPRRRRPTVPRLAAGALLLVAVPAAWTGWGAGSVHGPAPAGDVADGKAACGVGGPLQGQVPAARRWDGTSFVDPTRIEMTSTARARSARGTMLIRMGDTPYGVAVDQDGSYRLQVEVTVEGLRSPDGVHHVVWAATPELDRHVRLGTLGPDGRAGGELAWNKFLVFVTAETESEPDRWSQRILLSALSPSGRMHTMAGHGPFSGEPCLDPRS